MNFRYINTKKIRKIIRQSLTLSSLSILPLSVMGCSSDENNITTGSIIYEPGEHHLTQVKRDYNLFLGKNGTYSLDAPAGYKVLDYDYDFDLDNKFEYNDYIYENTEKINTNDRNKFGTPIEGTIVENNNNVYKAGEHNLISINRNFSLLGKFNELKTLESIEGYEIVDYDYDVTSNFEFENITYTNKVDVQIENKNEFGIPIKEENKENKDYYDIGEHTIVQIIRELNPFWGKNETKIINAPLGYEVIDYDYDKLDYTEYETIMYRNIVKVEKKENDFGTPLEECRNDEVYIIINRNLNLFIGLNKLKEVPKKAGYEIIDYDYDKNDSFEFETYVYKKIDKVNKCYYSRPR